MLPRRPEARVDRANAGSSSRTARKASASRIGGAGPCFAARYLADAPDRTRLVEDICRVKRIDAGSRACAAGESARSLAATMVPISSRRDSSRMVLAGIESLQWDPSASSLLAQ